MTKQHDLNSSHDSLKNQPSPNARLLAFKIFNSLMDAPQTLEDALQKQLIATVGFSPNKSDESEVRFARAMVLACLRHYRPLEGLIHDHLDHPFNAKTARKVMPILILGAAQLFVLNLPSHAVVNEMVNICKKLGLAGLGALVNRVLRKLSDLEPDQIVFKASNFPNHILNPWIKHYGQERMNQISDCLLNIPALDICFKSMTDFESYFPVMEAQIMQDHPKASVDVLVHHGHFPHIRIHHYNGKVQQLGGFHEGAWWVQDFASALVIHGFDDLRGLRVLDLCAAPGGKSLQMAALGANVTAIDKSPARIKRLRQNFTRMKLSVITKTADATLLDGIDLGSYDCVLLDAPCSASGTLRRHPEIFLRFQDQGGYDQIIWEFIQLQRKLSDVAIAALAHDGQLIYSVCSMDPREGEGYFDRMVKCHHEDIKPASIYTDHLFNRLNSLEACGYATYPLQPSVTPYLRLTPDQGCDGFFMAKFIKS